MNNAEKKFKIGLFLPDELVEKILIRLPAKTAARCRLVCRKWRDFTSSRDFVDLVSKNSTPPTILVANPMDDIGLDLFAVDEWWEFRRRKLLIYGFPLHSETLASNNHVLFSHDGLIVLNALCGSTVNDFIILNPANREHVAITLSTDCHLVSTIYGVYYHPLLKVYCSLFTILGASGAGRMEYKILNLCSGSILRTIRNPFDMRAATYCTPLLIGNYIYWLLTSEQGYCSGYNDIMEFDIIREEFKIIPCPVPLTTKCEKHQTCLLNFDGFLAFLLFEPSKITIWRLKDRAVNLWTVLEYPFSSKKYLYMDKRIAIVGGKLAFLSNRRLVVINLMNGSVKKNLKGNYGADASLLSHQMSLASLKNCKSRIIIDKDGEVLLDR